MNTSRLEIRKNHNNNALTFSFLTAPSFMTIIPHNTIAVRRINLVNVAIFDTTTDQDRRMESKQTKSGAPYIPWAAEYLI